VPAEKLEISRYQGMVPTRHASHILLELAGHAQGHQQTRPSVDTMWKHYHRGTAEAEAKKFWTIMPPSKAMF